MHSGVDQLGCQKCPHAARLVALVHQQHGGPGLAGRRVGGLEQGTVGGLQVDVFTGVGRDLQQRCRYGGEKSHHQPHRVLPNSV